MLDYNELSKRFTEVLNSYSKKDLIDWMTNEERLELFGNFLKKWEKGEELNIMENTIFDLKLHEEFDSNSGLITILRVSGGWIYKFYKREQKSKNDIDYRFLKLICSTFVPYNEEFKK
jgi:hypothetical protein